MLSFFHCFNNDRTLRAGAERSNLTADVICLAVGKRDHFVFFIVSTYGIGTSCRRQKSLLRACIHIHVNDTYK